VIAAGATTGKLLFLRQGEVEVVRTERRSPRFPETTFLIGPGQPAGEYIEASGMPAQPVGEQPPF
jgi:hypothetical protein